MYLAKKAYKDLCYSTISIETGMSGIATLQKAYESGNYDPDFEGNTLIGQILGEIGNWASLYHLDLSDNLLCGDIPFSLSKLKQLDALNSKACVAFSNKAADSCLENKRWFKLDFFLSPETSFTF
ncbi:LRR receptor-like serine/threonine-protein kinase ERL1 [Populus alba x Populus x berolinensis]|nr:LRR receptor-like serine/threonine-protein kinase ERL1 [Populus alba x Populus x berolinensis]